MMDTQEALKMAIEALEMSNDLIGYGLTDFTKYNLKTDSDVYAKLISTINTCKEALATNEDSLLVQPAQEPKCSKNPDAPHGFCRDASHSAGRYVCECEGWEAEQPAQEPVAKQYLVVDENDCHGDGSVYRGLRGKDSSIPTYRIETHPAPAREPLSEDEINKMAIDCGFETRMKDIVVKHSNGSWIEVGNRLNELARAIEKAHGIGEQV